MHLLYCMQHLAYNGAPDVEANIETVISTIQCIFLHNYGQLLGNGYIFLLGSLLLHC